MNITTGKRIWLSQASTNIVRSKPIIFWNTCALLDILRIPLLDRPQFNPQILQAYEQIESWIAAKRLVSVTSDLVVREFSVHADDIVNALSSQEQNLKNDVKEQSRYMTDSIKATRIASIIDLLDIHITSHYIMFVRPRPRAGKHGF